MKTIEEEEEIWRMPMWVYPTILGCCAVALLYRERARSLKGLPPLPFSFLSFQRKFLTVFYLAAAVEGFQNIYGESLYESKGLKREDIAPLLATTYFSSLFLGTFIGIFTDFIGRKKACLLYAFLQLASSLIKQSSNVFYLYIANVFQGIATSLYICGFEAWMTAEHEKKGFRLEWLNDTFWMMSFGGALVTLGSGAIGNFLVTKWASVGILAPTIIAAFCCGLVLLSVFFLWEENAASSRTPWVAVTNVVQLFNKRFTMIGWVHASFDLAMCVFWLLWTPILIADARKIDSVMIYPCLMASQMLGSVIAGCLLCGPLFQRPEIFLGYVFAVAAFFLALPAYDYQDVVVLVAVFTSFHFCAGLSWPSLAWLRSIYIPNECRAGAISLFRAPVNLILGSVLICGSLYRKPENSFIFTLPIMGLLGSVYCIHLLKPRIKHTTVFDELVTCPSSKGC